MAVVTAICDKDHKAMPGASGGGLEFALGEENHIFLPDAKAGTPNGRARSGVLPISNERSQPSRSLGSGPITVMATMASLLSEQDWLQKGLQRSVEAPAMKFRCRPAFV